MQRREAECHLIASVLAADGMFTDEERGLLEAAMVRLALDDDERDRVKHFEGSDAAMDVVKQLPEDARRALLDDLVEAALADGNLSPPETARVKEIASNLGL